MGKVGGRTHRIKTNEPTAWIRNKEENSSAKKTKEALRERGLPLEKGGGGEKKNALKKKLGGVSSSLGGGRALLKRGGGEFQYVGGE